MLPVDCSCLRSDIGATIAWGLPPYVTYPHALINSAVECGRPHAIVAPWYWYDAKVKTVGSLIEIVVQPILKLSLKT